ncbi:MAG: A/G-specific adenine glycosylase [Humisphaera sp.]|nr:A/G-specific adenine glycosylase [Humisphaera sp.]
MIGTNATFSKRLLRWYDAHRRDLPWRITKESRQRLNPYHVLVSEAMLQQTQVATVIPYFQRFIGRFPTIEHLAEADEQDVLRLWQGLGYYARARNLQKAAQRVVSEHGGAMPRTAEALRDLPGVGRYTAGAVASIAFDCRAPIVDGNVARVICRIDRIESDPREKQTLETIWQRAGQILPSSRCGDFNSALMELGATVCTPRNPKCLICPVREHCEAQAAGVQEQIPPVKKSKPTPLLRRDVLCIRDGQRWLIEQRPAKGRWAGMWQFITAPTAKTNRTNGHKQIAFLTHGLTHRRYRFRVLTCSKLPPEHANANGGAGRVWVTLQELDKYPLPSPHVKIAQMLRASETR